MSEIMMRRRAFIAGLSATALTGCAVTSPTGEDKSKLKTTASASAVKPCFHVFSKEFQSPVFPTPEAVCDLLATAGADGVQWTVRNNGHIKPDKAKIELPRLVKRCEERGLKCTSICTNITADAIGRPGLSEGAEDLLRIAADCGITQFRPAYFFYDVKNETFEQSRSRIHKGFENLAKLCERTGVKATYQNHSSWDETVFGGVIWDLYDCLHDLDPQTIGLEYDPMHAFFETNNSWTHGFDLVMPWIATVDLKDSVYELDAQSPRKTCRKAVAAGKGVIPWQEVRTHLDAAGIRPLFNLHLEQGLKTGDVMESVRSELDFFRKVLG